ncbi:MAG: HAD family acid phosphatase [Acidobacteriota bacterium]|nr:HAD family acid phosphatase [Acidobacteriota bacterium]
MIRKGFIPAIVLTAAIVVAAVFPGCAVVRTPVPGHAEAPPAALRDTHEMLDTVLWVQTSAEFRILAKSAFARAAAVLDAALVDAGWTAALEQTEPFEDLPPAVILDIDETVLDNSPFQGRLIADRIVFDRALWTEWTQRRAAPPIPGAPDFLAYAVARGVTVFYVTNRDASQEEDTRQNLLDLGLPVRRDIDNVLTRNENGWTSADKSERRAHVCRDYRVLLLVGDDLGDFVSGARDSLEKRTRLADAHSAYWEDRWILIPNPMYGSWESALYGFDSRLPEKAVLDAKFKAVKMF